MRREHVRRNSDEGLDTSILEDREKHNDPESDGELCNRFERERAGLRSPQMSLSGSVIGNIIPGAEVSVEEEHGNRAQNRKQTDDRTDPQRPCVGPRIGRNNVCCGRARELCKICNRPTRVEQ